MINKQSEIEKAHAWADLKEAYRHREKNYVVSAQVIGLEKLRYGDLNEDALKVYFNGIFGFIPISLVDDYEFKSLQSFVGADIQFVVQNLFDEGEDKLFLGNRKKALEALAVKFWRNALVGQVHHAYVSGVDNYGVYLLIEGVRVRMERQDYSHEFVSDLRDVVDIGETIDVQLMKIDKENKNIFVSRRSLEQDPRDYVNEYKRGGYYLGKVVNMDIDKGVFVRLEPRGLVALAGFPSNQGNRLLQINDQVNFKVMDIKAELGHIHGLIIVPQAAKKPRGNSYYGR